MLENFAKVFERLDAVEKNHGEFQGLILEYFGKFSERLEAVETNQAKLAIRLENEVIDKIKALFDGQAGHDQRFDRVDERLQRVDDKADGVAVDVGYLVVRVTKLEKAAR